MAPAFVLGIDCATQPDSTGYALAELGPSMRVLKTRAGVREESPATVAAELIGDRHPVLLALDAPLGWPISMGPSLFEHRAGAALAGEPNGLFRRHTDDVVAHELGKRPLDVGADRIARTAHAALRLLDDLRRRLGRDIPLGWTPGCVSETEAIEVYPAATLLARGLPATGYKRSRGREVREDLTRRLASMLEIADDDRRRMIETDHVLDAVLCCMAGIDYAAGRVLLVDDADRARREGWIWVRPPA